MNPTPRDISKSRWPQLSPLLDELLDMESTARAARLAALRALEPELAADLEDLLARDAELAGNDFLATPALPPTLTAALLMAGQAIGAYTLEREIGRGGMGSVWLARRTDGRYEGQVAIKFLSTGLLGHGDAGRFAREGQILARLTHPHIARLIDAGVALEGQQPYLVLEYVDGLTLDRFCASHQLDLGQRLRLFLDVLAAVAHAHNRLILHRDLKPSNILVNGAGEVKLLDFGIAKLLNSEAEDGGGAATELTRQAGRAFTPQYAAPEQVQGGDVTTATDVYALGVLLYQLLGGGHPTNNPSAGPPNKSTGTALEQLRTVVEVEPRRLSDAVRAQADPEAKKQACELRGDLDTIVAKALKKAPAERYANAAALADDLKRWLAHEPIAARPDSRSYRLLKFLRRHRLGVAAGSLAGLSLAVGIALALWKGQEAQQQRVQAEGLIEFMLGDLRKKLEPVGRLDVLDAVGDKALDYYARQDLARSDADSLGRRARALHLMGEIAEKQGHLDDADRMFREAAASTDELWSRDRNNTQRIYDHAQSAYWVGYIARRRGQADIAKQQFEHYLALADRLVHLEPSKIAWQVELASAHLNLGVLLLDAGQVEPAERAFMASVQSWKGIAAADASRYFELSNVHGWRAKALERNGRFDDAATELTAKIQAMERVPDGATNRRVQSLLASSYTESSRLQLALGHSGRAQQAARQAIDRFTVLHHSDNSNQDWLLQLCIAQLELADASLPEPLDGRDHAMLHQRVNLLTPANGPMLPQKIMLKARWLLTDFARADGLGPSRSEAFLLAVVAQEEKDGARFNAQQLGALARLEIAVGDALQAHAPQQAGRYWQRAAARLERLAGQGDIPTMVVRAVALHRLDRTQDARTLADMIKASSYRHPLYQDLRRTIDNSTTPSIEPSTQKAKP